ncbi:MAG: DUF5010 domain-containing protein [Deltaproteobacteria bacterium]|nr:DUF5010 domain-containing protein [Deltaproteobacteria bacterium]
MSNAGSRILDVRLLVPFVLALALACNGAETGADDAGVPDTGGGTRDAGGPEDRGTRDEGTTDDAGRDDAGGDAGAQDSGPDDTGAHDAGGTSDAGDTGTGSDAGTQNDAAQPADAGADSGLDAGHDAGPAADAGIDTSLVPPRTDGRVILAAITGYEMTNHCQEADDEGKCELPLFDPYNRDTIEWWYNLVEELAFSRVQLTLLHGRGCWDPSSGDEGSGNMCPRLLRHFVKAVYDKGLQGVIRVGMFDDTGAYPFARSHVEGLPDGTPFDLADRNAWRFFWDHNMKPWFETIPKELILLVDGRPVVAFWSLADAFFSNQQGNASELLKWLRQNMIDTFGLDPIFNVDTTWASEDTTITPAVAQGVNDWFGPPAQSYTVRNWGGKKWGCLVPGYRNVNTFPGCGAPCREIPREDGGALQRGLDANRQSAVLLLEGFTNIAESAGFYRSDQWAIPNRYLGLLREAADFETETLRYEAEAADAYHDTTPGNAGGQYRLKGDLDVGRLPEGTGWFVGWTGAGEWVEFKDVQLSCGTYRFLARISSDTGGAKVRLEVDGSSLGTVEIPSTGGWDAYGVFDLGMKAVAAGRHTLRFVFENGLCNLDWFYHRKVSGICQ